MVSRTPVPAVLLDLPPLDPRAWSAAGAAAAGLPRPLEHLAQALGWTFGRPALLRVAVTHPGWANEHRAEGWPSNGALEFFGDAVLDLAAADAIWRRFPALAEGDLTRLRAAVVSEGSLAAAARSVELGAYLYLGRGDERAGFRDHDGTLADALEAVLGALFLDARDGVHDPFEAAVGGFARLFGARVAAMRPTDGLDPKSALQRVVQAELRDTPRYRTLEQGGGGPERAPWRVAVEVVETDPRGAKRPRVLAEGSGRSVQAAERAAAAAALAAWPEAARGPAARPGAVDGRPDATPPGAPGEGS